VWVEVVHSTVEAPCLEWPRAVWTAVTSACSLNGLNKKSTAPALRACTCIWSSRRAEMKMIGIRYPPAASRMIPPLLSCGWKMIFQIEVRVSCYAGKNESGVSADRTAWEASPSIT
jgi:hypothetical protein